ncbi:MAG: hypothetical protein MIO92_16255 [Methanosarcinaceae archaeon]|nr:hypothetical protein [Methanosarcinaceae archaeon]
MFGLKASDRTKLVGVEERTAEIPGCFVSEPSQEKVFKGKVFNHVGTLQQDFAPGVYDTRPRPNDTEIRDIVGTSHAGLDEVIINSVIILKEKKIIPLRLFETEIEIVVWADIHLMPMITNPWVGKGPDKGLRIVCRAIVGHDYFNILICLV